MECRRTLDRMSLTASLVFAAALSANAQPPAAPALGVASGDVIGSDLTFTWNPVATATWYHLMVQDTTGVKLDAWFTTAQAHCAVGEPGCRVGASVTLASGLVYWWVQAWSPAGYSGWSPRGDFNALRLDMSGDLRNTFLGPEAGQAVTADENTGIGALALTSHVNGAANTAIGAYTLQSSISASGNTAVGTHALKSLVGGQRNVAIGWGAMISTQSGSENTGVGSEALRSNTGQRNTAVGNAALREKEAGDNNIAVGNLAGSSLQSGSNNIFIGNSGTTSDSNAIRIGGGTHTVAAIGGIHGQTSASGIPVLVNSLGTLGTATSSARYKEDIRDIGDATAALAKLRPVEFHYRASLDPDRITQYGLIAEEVAKVWPELVVYDAEGRPETVRYHLLVPLLLNELQRVRAHAARENGALRAALDTVLDRLAALEAANAADRDP